MADSYSVYEAKARFSAILRRVREGHTIIVSHRGEPVAEIRPYRGDPTDIHARLERLAERNVLVRPAGARGTLAAAARKRGALRRFLRDRDS